MKLISTWLDYFKKEQPALHQGAKLAYIVFPILLALFSIYDGLPFLSFTTQSMLASIALGLAILGATHLSIAGTMCSLDKGDTQQATTIACYGGFTLIVLFLLVP